MRRRATRGLRALLLAPLLGLGGCAEDEAPTDASAQDFCSIFETRAEAQTGQDFRRFGQDLEQVGTPADISDDGREGFTVVVRVARSLDADATREELEDPDVTDTEEAQARTFLDYGNEKCGALGGGF